MRRYARRPCRLSRNTYIRSTPVWNAGATSLRTSCWLDLRCRMQAKSINECLHTCSREEEPSDYIIRGIGAVTSSSQVGRSDRKRCHQFPAIRAQNAEEPGQVAGALLAAQ